MSNLHIDQQSVFRLFSDKESDFLIPDYQRPYAWEEIECQTLWDDLFSFAFPDLDSNRFNAKKDQYFLGPIVTFINEEEKKEIIDGQQRLTTLMLLLRAFYDKFTHAQDEETKATRDSIARCIWKTNEFNILIKDELKIDSQVSSDDDKDEFLAILKTGIVGKDYKSRYAKAYTFFVNKIDEFVSTFPMWCASFPARIMNNCILLPIEAESQDTALRIFSTLNDRGKPLSDADIFKAQFYKYYSDKGEKDSFIKRWKDLEGITERIFKPQSGTPMDELFSRYMYYLRALQGNRNTTTEALRKFFERDSYKLLKNDNALSDLETLALFWQDVETQDDSFSDRVLRKLFVLNYAPNSMWTYFVSCYFLTYRDENNELEENAFYEFLDKITAFIFAYSFERPGVNALRTPGYPAMINIVNKMPVTFDEYRFERETMKNRISTFVFSNSRTITKSMLTWWAFTNKTQQLYRLDETLEIEHIFARKRQEYENSLSRKEVLESIGNKALLEKGINIRAADYKFNDKKKYYLGFITDKGKVKKGTKDQELVDIAQNKSDFVEEDINDRKGRIIDAFLDYLAENALLV